MWKVILLGLLACSQTQQAPTSQDLKKPTYDYALEAIFAMGVRLQVLLEEPVSGQLAKNFLVSPLSSTLMIGQLMIGAEGKFREELYDLLSLPKKEEHKVNSVIGYFFRHNQTSVNFNLPYAELHLQLANLLRQLEGFSVSKLFNLTTSNALFTNSNLQLKGEFVHNLDLYRTYTKQLDFGGNPQESLRVINNWAAERTNNLIQNILSSPPSASDAAIFMNAVYFKGDWVTPFSYELTYESEFHLNKNVNISVEYMRGFIEEITYGESSELGCKMIGLPYQGDEVVMYIFLPNENNGTEFNIKNFTSKFNFKNITEFINKSRKHDVNLQLPKMKLSNRISLLQPLRKYKAFKDEMIEKTVRGGDSFDTLQKIIDEYIAFKPSTTPELYLNNAGQNANIKVSDILQEMTLTVDEKGTEAAAVTASLVNYSGGSKNFKIDRPFVLFLRHEPTSAILFWGSIANPIQVS